MICFVKLVSFCIWCSNKWMVLVETGEWRSGACFGEVRSCKTQWKVWEIYYLQVWNQFQNICSFLDFP